MFIRDTKENRIRLLQHRQPQGSAHSVAGVRRFKLRKDQAMQLELDTATEIRCVQGLLWLTIDGDLNDYMLSTGQVALVQNLRPIHVVVAFHDSVLSLTNRPDLTFIREPWTRRVHRRLNSWLKQELRAP